MSITLTIGELLAILGAILSVFGALVGLIYKLTMSKVNAIELRLKDVGDRGHRNHVDAIDRNIKIHELIIDKLVTALERHRVD